MQPDEVSMTARGVAAYRRAFERVDAPYGDPNTDQRLQEDVAAGMPAPTTMIRYLRARTRWFDRAVVDAIAAGATQVVAVGAGYDGRSLRYAAPGVRWFELDHPATQADKRARLDRLGIVPAEVAFVPADFTVDDLATALPAAGFDREAATLFTSEGVLGYLPAPVVEAQLRTLAALAGPGSRLAAEVPLEPDTPAEVERRAQLRAVVQGLGEPLVSAVGRHELHDLLADLGWRVVRATDPAGEDVRRTHRTTAFVLAEPAGG